MKRIYLLVGLMILAGSPTGQAVTNWYVATNGTGGGTSWADATNSIQGAINKSSAGDTVWVSNGVYNTGVYDYFGSNRIYITKAITVRSFNNEPANTIIEGLNDGGTNGPASVRCVEMEGTTPSAWLIGFTLTNGATTPAQSGGGIMCRSTTAPIISNCVITGNSSSGYGGGGAYYGTLYNCLLVGNSTPGQGGGACYSILYNCTLIGNSASNLGGGGVYNGTLYNCALISNTASATSEGAGVYQSTLYNCRLLGNYGALRGGGTSGGTLVNCTVVGNSDQRGGIYAGNCNNCIVWSNTPANWYDNNSKFTNSCTYPTQSIWQVTDMNITNNPMFVDIGSGYGTNFVMGDYRLRQESPCINVGANAYVTTNMPTDLDGHSRIDRYSGIVDMGCFENIPSGVMITVP
jgi:hypothetical protein